jgi:hypothetical protein
MSKYMPPEVVQREHNAQQVRRAKGLKTGFYVRFPDPEKGPFTLTAKRLAQCTDEELRLMREFAEKVTADAQKLKQSKDATPAIEPADNFPSVTAEPTT